MLAVLFTPIVVLAGLWEQQRLHLNHPVLEQHKAYAFATMGLSLISLPILWLLKKWPLKTYRLVITSLLLCLVILVAITAYLGGSSDGNGARDKKGHERRRMERGEW